MFFPETWKSSSLDFVLGTPALIIGVWKFGKGAFYSLKAGSANMYVLILMGAITAYVFSIYLYFTGKSPLYFETTAVIIALVMVGDNLEEKAIEKTTSSLSSLAKMQIKNAKKLINGIFEEVSLNAIKKGDTVQVNQGDQIPTDGEVLEGSGMVDEALLTGESEPIFKEKAAQLFSGTTLIDGQFTYKVSKPGHLSALARINGLVQKASTEKANIQKLHLKQGFAEEAINEFGQFDAMNLSNIFEYMNDEIFENTTQSLIAGLNKGGRMAYWNLMVARRMSSIFESELSYQKELSEKLTAVDKGFFYGGFLVDERGF